MRISKLAVLAVVAILAVGAAGAFAYLQYVATTTTNSSGCVSNYLGPAPVRTQLASVALGHLTEFELPNARAPNGITVAPDGSVWFGEESMPALAHLFQNGTLLEYVWPGAYPPQHSDYSCGFRTQIWGVALWNGTVWAGDASGSQLVSLNPRAGAYHFFKLSSGAFPYYLTAGPDGNLWFTELYTPSIVELSQNGTTQTYTLPTGIRGTPTQILFVNSSYALYADAGQAGEENGGIYGFNPAHPTFTRVGGSRQLTGVTGLGTASGGIWISEHGPPFLSFYNRSSSSWTSFPTSLLSYASTTLPYFIKSDGVHVWFNEHYGDRISEIDTSSGSMIEYAISNPPAANLSSITAAQTIARDGEKIWFTELAASRVGFANFASPPPFAISSISPREFKLARGGSVALSFNLQGTSESPVQLKFSDSETSSAVPTNLNASSSAYLFTSLAGGNRFTVTLSAKSALAPGTYVFDVTVTDGSTTFTVFLRVDVP